MKIRTVHISDHALVRFLERVHGVDVEAMRIDLERQCRDAAKIGASTFTVKGVKFCFSAPRDGAVVVTTIKTPDMGSSRSRYQREFAS